MKVAFVTNFCPHYRVKTFETLAKYHDVDFFFFSAGDEWYWQQEHGVRTGVFHYEYLPGLRLGQTRITPSLIQKLWQRDYDVYVKGINGRFVLPITYTIARLKRVPFILWTGIWMRLQTPAHRFFFPFTRHIYRHADAIVVYGEHVKRYLVSEGVVPEKIFIAAHAVDNEIYSQTVTPQERDALYRQLKIEAGQKIVLYLGRLETGKGLSYLLDAFVSLPNHDSVLVIAGTGSKEKLLKMLVAEKGIANRVRFVGYVPPEKTPLYYNMAWVYVLPSVTTPVFKEPWGLVVNEAFNQGVPVIASDAVGAAAGGLVQDGVNGFVVPERNSEALARALEQILNDPDLRQRLSLNARNTITGWDNERMVSGFRQAIAHVHPNRLS